MKIKQSYDLTSPKILRNKYYLLRHGESHANREGIVISEPETGTSQYGLTGKGTESVIETAINTRLDYDTIVYSSDFLRTKETAETFAKVIDAKPATLTKALRERFFGEWEKTSTANYPTVWAADADNSHCKNSEVESVYAVAERALNFIKKLERLHSNEKILLVSHGDTLQILITAFAGICPSKHRSLSPIKTAEIRSLSKRSLALFSTDQVNKSNHKLESSVA